MGEKRKKRKSKEKPLEPINAPEKRGLGEYAEKVILKNSSPERKARILLLVVLTFLCLLPFVGKPFHIDDPLFIWTAKNIQANPLDPYGFNVNWYGIEERMADVNKNPPIVSYYIAAVASILGWNETALHIAFLIPAIAVITGTFLIAEKFCMHPLLAGLAALLTPVFLVSSTTVMSDIMMLAFWVFAVYFWVSGVDNNKFPLLLVSAILIPICALTKYFGMALIPLLLFYSVFKRRSVGRWALFMLLSVAVLAWYQWETHSLYGHGLLMDAASYAIDAPSNFGRWSLPKLLVGLSFTGGCIIVVLLFTNLIWSWKEVSAGAALTVIMAVVVASAGSIGTYRLPADAAARWIAALEFGLFISSGISLLAISILDFKDRKDAGSSLLLLWVMGTFVFAAFVNWTTAARSILPMVPAAGILIGRRMEQRRSLRKPVCLRQVLIPLIGAAVVSLAVTWADYKFADSARAAAADTRDKYISKGHNTWFTGHWGFQYYMQEFGAKPFDVRLWPAPGDIFAVPRNSSNNFLPHEEYVRLIEIIEVPQSAVVTTANSKLGAGFYSDVFGPLPFAVGKVPSDQYRIFEVIR
ncbi:MAG: glycosyltransferase family 39 protein [Nitrospirae bacterium]|nr:glycosyltransferase family 39 protein [Nitrospirota bacterium]